MYLEEILEDFGHPTFSPDERRIAYTEYVVTGGVLTSADLQVRDTEDVTDVTERQISDGSERAAAPDW